MSAAITSPCPSRDSNPPGGVLQQDTACGPNRNRSARSVAPPRVPTQETPWMPQLNDYSVEFPPETQDLFVSSTPYLGHAAEQVASADHSKHTSHTDTPAQVRESSTASYDGQDNNEEHTSYKDDSHDPVFTPIVQLPENVELMTGEEDSTTLISSRAKLYRFIDSQWKERGVGTIKILYNAMLGRIRVVMRRDQVHKVCANHLVQPGAAITYKDKEKKTLMWTALDFTDDNGPHMENFCCRFKTPEMATEFKDMYEQAKGLSGVLDDAPDGTAVAYKSPGGSATTQPSEKPVSLLELFGAKPGSWECDTCLVRNPADVTVCPACMTPKAGLEATSKEQQQPVTAISMNAGGGFKFAASGGTQFSSVAFSSTPVKSGSNETSFHTPVTFSLGTPAVASSPTLQTSSWTQGMTTDKPSQPAVMLFGKKDADTNHHPPAESDQLVPANLGWTGQFGQQDAVSTDAAVVSTTPATSFTFSKQSTPGAKAPFSFGSSTFTETASATNQAVDKLTAPSNTTETKTVIGGFSFVGPNVSQTVAVTSTAPVAVSVKATDKPNPFATFSFASTKAEIVSTSSSANNVPLKPFSSFSGTTSATAPTFGGFGATQPTVSNASTSTAGGTGTSTTSIFGGVAAAPVFGSGASVPLVGSASTSKSTDANTFSKFGNVAPAPIFGSVSTADNTISDGSSALTFGNSASAMTFASVAAMGESPDAFSKNSESATGFQMSKGKLFESQSSPAGPHEPSDGHTEDYEPTAEFEPVVSLPHVELKTGEEDEDKIFGERARLYRLDSDTKQWKERGIGIIKILRHQYTGKNRIVMRREQVFKLCANHNLTADMTLRPLATSDRAWCWFARDFAEDDKNGEGILEHLAAKFKTPEIAVKFKDMFEDCVKQSSLNTSGDTFDRPHSTTGHCGDASVPCRNLADMFRLKNGEWQCDMCLVKNSAGAATCAACQTPHPISDVSSTSQSASTPNVVSGTMKLAELLGEIEPEEPAGTFGRGQSLAEMFRTKVGEWECDACLVKNKSGSIKCAACETPKPGCKQEVSSSSVSSSFPLNVSSTGGFTFSSGSTFNFAGDAAKSTSNVAASTGFSFDQFVSSSTGTFSFGGTTTSDAKSSCVPTLFGTPAVGASSSNQFTPSQFRFGASASTPGNQPLDLSKSPLQSPELYHDEETNVYFEPVVHLPDNFEVKTGEEDEEVLYVHRAKLYRFCEGEWKERGLGDVKLLRHCTTRRTRVLMRREQVLKICLNHGVTQELELKPMEGAKGCAWVWHADDFADGSSKHEQFAIRFKTAADADGFKIVFDSAKKDREASSEAAGASDTDNEDVIIVYEKLPTPEQMERARVFQLPDTFYLYEDAPPCPGCIGCEDDDQQTSASSSRIPRPTVKAQTSSSESTLASRAEREPHLGQPAILRQPLFSAPALKKDPPDKSTQSCNADKPSFLQQPRFGVFGLTQLTEGSPSGGTSTGEVRKSQLKELLFGDSKLCTAPPSAMSQSLACDSVETSSGKAGVASPSAGGVVFGGGNMLAGNGFAGLAAKASSGFTFGNKSDEPFAFSGAGTTLFGAAASTAADQDSGDDSNVSQEANVHFEPVVSLPEVTDLRTGEEDCDVLFCQRAKLYRFTDKQWKERGIGEMKLLRNRETGRVRVLLRREQVLKVACNHNLTTDITLQPLLTSETAWCWSALDYVDGEGQHEQFAVKFKTKELATRFKDVFEQCQRQLTDYPGEDVVRSTDSEDTHLKELTVVDSGTVVADNEPPADTLSNTLTSSGSGANVNSGEQALTSPRDDYDDDDDDDDDSSQEQLEQVFWKRATMYYIEDGHAVSRGQGELSVVVDEDVVGLRVCMKTDAGHLVCSHVICCGYSITKTSKNCCEWAGQDFSTDEPIPRHFRVQLSSTDALDEFMYCFQQGVLRAQESQLYETMPEMVPISPGNNSTARTQ